MQTSMMCDVYLQKTAKREIHILYLVKGEGFVEPLKIFQVDILEREIRMIIKQAPLLACKALKG